MPLDPRVMWDRIKKSLKGKSHEEQREILEAYLAEWPQFRGPYREMKKKIVAMLERLQKLEQTKTGRKKKGDTDQFLSIKKQGIARMPLLGVPNTGKSTIFKTLTHKDVLIAEYPFTTQQVTSGLYQFNHLSLQVLDLPPIIEDSSAQLHYGTELWHFIKTMGDIICLVIDGSTDIGDQLLVVLDELEQQKIRLMPGNNSGTPQESFTDKKGFVLFTKIEHSPSSQMIEDVRSMLPNLALCSTATPEDVSRFQQTICELLGLITVFSRIPHTHAEEEPFSLPQGACVHDLAYKIHKEVAQELKYAKIWGDSVKFPGQRVNKDHVLHEPNILEIYT